jgi:hypothetical protein
MLNIPEPNINKKIPNNKECRFISNFIKPVVILIKSTNMSKIGQNDA